jgi:hypothetical protein
VVAAVASSADVFDDLLADDAHLGAGLAEHALGRHVRAIAHLEAAERAFIRRSADGEDVMDKQQLALTRRALAAALRASGQDEARAAELERAAAAFHRDNGSAAYR